MGLRPTQGDESALLRPIDSKWVTRDFRRSLIDFSSTIKLADNPSMTDPSSDSPATLAEAVEKFKKFLAAQHWPEAIRGLTQIASW